MLLFDLVVQEPAPHPFEQPSYNGVVVRNDKGNDLAPFCVKMCSFEGQKWGSCGVVPRMGPLCERHFNLSPEQVRLFRFWADSREVSQQMSVNFPTSGLDAREPWGKEEVLPLLSWPMLLEMLGVIPGSSSS